MHGCHLCMFKCMYVCMYICMCVCIRSYQHVGAIRAIQNSVNKPRNERNNIRKRGSGKRKLDLPYADGYYSD